MKRSYFLAAGLVALVASAASACHRNDCASTTSTTSATVNASEPGLQAPGAAAPNSDRATASPAQPAAPAAPAPTAEAPSTTGTGATPGAAAGSTATTAAESGGADARATTGGRPGPVDITGPSPAVTSTAPNGNAASAVPDNIRNMGGTSVAPYAGNAPWSGPGNADATSTTMTTGAPMVTHGLDNTVTGGVGNIGAPIVSGSGGMWYAAPTGTMSQPIGGAMRPGAASDPNTTAGGR